MKTSWAPSQVMREGRDLNQHGQAGRQEQASSSSPLIFHEVLLAAAAALPGRPSAVMPHTIASETIDLPDIICFINFFHSLRRCRFLRRMYSRKRRGQYRMRQCQSQAGDPKGILWGARAPSRVLADAPSGSPAEGSKPG